MFTPAKWFLLADNDAGYWWWWSDAGEAAAVELGVGGGGQ